MRKHTKIYLDYFDYGIEDFIFCEIPDCHKKAIDIHHIEARGAGGDPQGKKDVIENLMAVCREHHDKYGDKKQYKPWLKVVHNQFMNNNGLCR